MKRRNWFDELTPDEQSMIATCIANDVPLCCAEGHKNVLVITQDRRKRDNLTDYAYDRLGCQYGDDLPRVERYLNNFLEACGYEEHDMHDEILAWEAESLKRWRKGVGP